MVQRLTALKMLMVLLALVLFFQQLMLGIRLIRLRSGTVHQVSASEAARLDEGETVRLRISGSSVLACPEETVFEKSAVKYRFLTVLTANKELLVICASEAGDPEQYAAMGAFCGDKISSSAVLECTGTVCGMQKMPPDVPGVLDKHLTQEMRDSFDSLSGVYIRTEKQRKPVSSAAIIFSFAGSALMLLIALLFLKELWGNNTKKSIRDTRKRT